MSQAQPDTNNTRRSERLADAFQQFNELSRSLSHSYQELQDQVAGLHRQLAAAHDERLKTLTEKEQLANRLSNLIETLPGGVIVLDSGGVIVSRNRTAADLLGEPLLGCLWRDVVSRCFVPAADDPHEQQLVNGKFVNLSICPPGRDCETVILLTDVSEVRRLQDVVNHQHRLSAMGEMVASLAHQIRTPLSTAILYGSHLSREDLSSAQRERFSRKLVDRLKFLERQVNDMLLFARDGTLAMEACEVSVVVSRVEDAAEMLLTEAGIQLEVEDSASMRGIRCNADALTGALMNLVTNSVEVMPRGGRLRLRLRDADNRVEISLHDQGPGIDPAVSKRVFEPFFTTRSRGTGLGLAVVASVARIHGGRVWCDQGALGGAGFFLELPVVESEQPLQCGVFDLERSVEVV